MIAAEFLIFIGYVWFALQCGVFAKDKNDAQRVFAALVVVFVLCAFNGYLVPAIIDIVPNLPEWVKPAHLASHWLLVAATAYLVLSNGARHIKDKLSANSL